LDKRFRNIDSEAGVNRIAGSKNKEECERIVRKNEGEIQIRKLARVTFSRGSNRICVIKMISVL
jgi:hypothetical protein